jgi:hypothetical protein
MSFPPGVPPIRRALARRLYLFVYQIVYLANYLRPDFSGVAAPP